MSAAPATMPTAVMVPIGAAGTNIAILITTGSSAEPAP
jgi:hypothetical protein